MALDDQVMPYGLRQVRITNSAGSSQAILDAAQTFSFAEAVETAELQGNDQRISQVAHSSHVEWSLEEGGIPLTAYAIMTGRTVISSGTTPGQVYTLYGLGGECFPFFKVYGKAVLDDCIGDMHCKLTRCKLSENIEGNLGNGEFWVTKAGGVALADSANDNKIFEFVIHETAEDLPST
ncbi:MAG: hypothetical protein JXA14_22920 [Anaerolineae bacterium]|nr:hypothetical protein [Anaerolineae bacterium]